MSMEGAPQFEGEKKYNREDVAEQAMEQALDMLEEKLSMPFEDASPEERMMATAELLADIDMRRDNSERHVAEAISRMRRLAELELSFKTEHAKLSEVLH
jgi:hypothetical protein